MEILIFILLALTALAFIIKRLTKPKPKLALQRIPRSMQYRNVRSETSATLWKKISDQCFQKANGHNDPAKYVCELCAGNGQAQGRKHRVECHEEWRVDWTGRKLSLTNLLCVCPLCHQVFHFLREEAEEKKKLASMTLVEKEKWVLKTGTLRGHMAKVNGWSPAQVEQHIKEFKNFYYKQPDIRYKLDLRYLNKPEFVFTDRKWTDDEGSKV